MRHPYKYQVTNIHTHTHRTDICLKAIVLLRGTVTPGFVGCFIQCELSQITAEMAINNNNLWSGVRVCVLQKQPNHR